MGRVREYVYTALATLWEEAQGSQFGGVDGQNFYGVVVDGRAPFRTSGTDHMAIVFVTDHSLQDGRVLELDLFCKSDGGPDVAVGDIVRVHRARVQLMDGRLVVRTAWNRTITSLVLFKNRDPFLAHDGPARPVETNSWGAAQKKVIVTEADTALLLRLRAWACNHLLLRNESYCIPLREILNSQAALPEGLPVTNAAPRCDLVALAVAVNPDVTGLLIQLWDGTGGQGAPGALITARVPNEVLTINHLRTSFPPLPVWLKIKDAAVHRGAGFDLVLFARERPSTIMLVPYWVDFTRRRFLSYFQRITARPPPTRCLATATTSRSKIDPLFMARDAQNSVGFIRTHASCTRVLPPQDEMDLCEGTCRTCTSQEIVFPDKRGTARCGACSSADVSWAYRATLFLVDNASSLEVTVADEQAEKFFAFAPPTNLRESAATRQLLQSAIQQLLAPDTYLDCCVAWFPADNGERVFHLWNTALATDIVQSRRAARPSLNRNSPARPVR